MKMKNIGIAELPPGLYLVATPIGNLRDVTLRALDILASADLVVCEDTRVTGKLLDAFSLKKKMLPYNDHNAVRQRPKILEALGNNQRVAFTSDAGMPLISDPGYKLVRDCIDLGYYVTTAPGPSAPLAALQLAGLPADRFVFLGFLPVRSEARKKTLREWKSVTATLIFFETAPRLAVALKDMEEILGDRPAAVAREITKRFEECRRGTLAGLAAAYESDPPKGEIVLIVQGAAEMAASEDALSEQVKAALKKMSVRDAAAFVAESSGEPRRKIYELALALSEKIETDE